MAVNATVFEFSNDVAEVRLLWQGFALRDAVMLASRADQASPRPGAREEGD
jgi:hypothetical protein